MSTQIEAVLWDYAGVFTNSPFEATAEHARREGIEAGVLLAAIFGPYHEDTDHPWHRLERGEIELEPAVEAIAALGKAQGFEANPIKILLDMGKAKGGGVRAEMVDLAREVKTRGFRTALVTNNALAFRDYWRKTIPLEEMFHEVIDSSEVGVRKPDPRIFQLTLERLGGTPPENSVFLDDHPGNVAAAKSLGMHGILVERDPSGAMEALGALLA